MKIFKTALAIGALTFSLLAQAAPKAVVEAVQMPAWLDREGETVPVTPGMKLQAEDRLRTGSNARLLLKMPEGSTVKLGENASFSLAEMQYGKIFRATMNVLNGAFRFTTDALSRSKQREVTVHITSVTLGIRGTDVWGKSAKDKDIVCLLEGQVTVGSEGNSTIALKDPLEFYQKPRNAAPLPVGKVDAAKLRKWAQETEVERGGAVAGPHGEWRVIVASFQDKDDAHAFKERLRTAGYPAELQHENVLYAVEVAGLAGEAEANALAAKLVVEEDVSEPTVVK